MRRCIIVLDRDGDAYPAPVSLDEADVFERAIVAAASLVLSADRSRSHDALRHRRRSDLPWHQTSAPTRCRSSPHLNSDHRSASSNATRRGPRVGRVVATSSPAADAWRRTERISIRRLRPRVLRGRPPPCPAVGRRRPVQSCPRLGRPGRPTLPASRPRHPGPARPAGWPDPRSLVSPPRRVDRDRALGRAGRASPTR